MQVPDPRHGLLQRVVESSPLAMVVTEESGRILLVNSRTEQMFGYDAHDLIGQPVEKLIPSRFRDGHVRMRAAFTAAPSVREMGDRLGIKGLRRDGTEFPVSIHLSTMDAPMGRMTVAWISDQTLAQDRERRLLELNALLESVNRSIPGAIFQRPLKEDGSLEFSYFAGDFAQRWRLTVVEVARNPAALFRFIHPDDLATIAGALNTQKDNHAARELEFRMLTADGDLRWINLRTRVDTNPAGEPVRTGVLLDVTDQKRTEAALAESERRFRAIIAHLPGAVFQQVFRPNGTMGYNFISEGIEQITGTPAAEFMRDPQLLGSLFLAEEREQQLQAEALGRSGEAPFRTRQFRVRRKDGIVRWLQTRSTVHRAQDGTMVWDGITIDITEEKGREEELQEAQRRVVAMTENVPAVVFERIEMPGEEPRMVFVNRRVSEMFGLSQDGFLGKTYPLRDLMHKDDKDRVVAEVKRCADTGEDWLDEFRIVLAGQGDRWVRGSAKQVQRPDGSIVWTGVYIDITPEKQAKLAAERLADQTRAELLLAAQLQGYMMWEAQVPPYLKAATYYRPSQEVSGDILYSRALRNGEFLCAIGDATGHGVTAALLTMLTVALLDASEDTWTPAEILRRLNDHLGRRGLDGRSVTCIVIKFRPDGGILAANAGHPPALILSKATEAATTIESSGPPLGWFPDQAYEDFTQTLSPGSTLFVYTDGLSEMSGSSGAQFGLERILNIAAQAGAQPTATMEQLVETMSVAAVTHAEGEPPDDDISFVAIRFEPPQG